MNNFEKKVYEHMKLREGYKNEVYLDTLGKATCGIGHLLTASEKQDYPVGTEVDDYIVKEWYLKVKSRPSFKTLLKDQIVGLNPDINYDNLDF